MIYMQKLKKLMMLSLAFVSLWTGSCNAATAMTASQSALLSKAKYYGSLVGYPETIQAILLQETMAGALGKVGDDGRSLGVMQMQPETAMYVTSKYSWLPQLQDKAAYAAFLLKSDDYAILLGALYFKECLKVHHTWKRAVVCYNYGIAGATNAKLESNKYLASIIKHIKTLRSK
jgi:hypothetical protein